MIIRNFTYKGTNLSDSLATTTKIVIDNIDKNVQLRTAIFDKVNYHGASSSFTLASGRLISVSGVIFWDTRQDRWIGENILNSIIVPESNPTPTKKGFYECSWIDDWWNEVSLNAKVHKMPTYKHVNWTSIIEFSFELYSEEAYYTSINDKNANWWYWFFWWVSLPTTLSIPMDWLIGSFDVNNLWNFDAPCKIEVIWDIDSPKINNITTGVYYGVSSNTSDFIVDTRSSKAIITDAGVDISAFRMDWSKFISIAPGINKIVLQWSNYNSDSIVTINITYRDTYISS